jgi:hypothetical protein
MSNIILPNTSLCAIVRDEKENAAGGIIDFVDSTMPYVEAGVIVDTGSLDGTREVLEELQSKYPNLVILDRQFNGFSDSRNYSLQNVQTKLALVLDADERLTKKDFSDLHGHMIDRKDIEYPVYHFSRRAFVGNDQELWTNNGKCTLPRIFVARDNMYVGDLWEELINNYPERTIHWETGIEIKHFYSSSEGKDAKEFCWYAEMENYGEGKKEQTGKRTLEGFRTAPTQSNCFKLWKQFNPKREEFR